MATTKEPIALKPVTNSKTNKAFNVGEKLVGFDADQLARLKKLGAIADDSSNTAPATDTANG